MVPESVVKKTEITVDQAFKFHLSLGVMTPQNEKIDITQKDSTQNS